jgi:SAM-dependent methyltransferase
LVERPTAVNSHGGPRWLASLELACPDCRHPLEEDRDGLRCGNCRRFFPYEGQRISLLPSGSRPVDHLDLGTKYHGRLREVHGWRRRLFDSVYRNPAQFIGDRQALRGKNAHEKVIAFVDADPTIPVLDIGSGNRRLGPNVITTDLGAGSDIDIQLDAHALPFASESVVRIVLQHVLEHASLPLMVIAEISRVLCPGGRVYVEVPFLFPVHERSDFHRWTIAGIKADLAPLRTVESGVTMGPWTALEISARAALTHRIANTYLSTLADVVAGWILAPLMLIDRWSSVIPESQIGAGAVYVIAEKERAEP